MKVEMKRVLAAPRFAVVVICVLALISVAAFAQGDSEAENHAGVVHDQAMQVLEWPIVYQEDFAQPEGGWEGIDEKSSTARYVDGTYELHIDDGGWSEGVPGPIYVTDFSLELKAKLVGGEGAFGVVFWYQDESNFSVLLLDASSFEWRLLHHDGGSDLRPAGLWVEDEGPLRDDFNPCEWNSLLLRVEGQELTFSLNGDVVAVVDLSWSIPVSMNSVIGTPRFSDATLCVGELGIAVLSSDIVAEGTGISVRFDDVVIRRHPRAPSHVPDVLARGASEGRSVLNGAYDHWHDEPALAPVIDRVPVDGLDEVEAQLDLTDLDAAGYPIERVACRPRHLARASIGPEESVLVVSDEDFPVLYIADRNHVDCVGIVDLLPGYTFGSSTVESLATGDLNGDGIDEIILATAESVFVSNYRDGEMETVRNLPLAENEGRVVAADLDGDGRTDLVTSNGTYYQGQDGSFVYVAYGSPRRMCHGNFDVRYDLAVEDLDQDGLLDVVRTYIAGLDTCGVDVLHQDATRDFSVSFEFPVHSDLSGLAVGDVTGDSLPDICITVNTQHGYLAVFEQEAAGRFANPNVYPAYDLPSSPVIGDFNGDGLDDIATLHDGWDRIGVYVQRPDTGLAPYVLYAVPTFNGGGVDHPRMMLVDRRADEKPDQLIMRSWVDQLACVVSIPPLAGPSEFHEAASDPAGSSDLFPLLEMPLADPAYVLVPIAPSRSLAAIDRISEPEFRAMVSGDLTGNGREEIVVIEEHVPTLWIYEGLDATAFDLGAGEDWHRFTDVDVADLEGDGWAEIIVTTDRSPNGVTLLVYLYDPYLKQLLEAARIRTDTRQGGVVAADVNGDGVKDLVMASGVHYLRCEYTGSFVVAAHDPLASSDTGLFPLDVVDLAVADFNSDGLLDVVRTYERGGGFENRTRGAEILYASPAGGFTAPIPVGPVSTEWQEVHVAAGDLNGDGAADLVLCTREGTYTLEQGAGGFGAPACISANVLCSPIIEDFDGDGVNDLVFLGTWDEVVAFRSTERGEVRPAFEVAVSTTQNPDPKSFVVSDLDGNGNVELIALANYDLGLTVLPDTSLRSLGSVEREDSPASFWRHQLEEAKTDFGRAWSAFRLGSACLAESLFEEALGAAQQAVETASEAGITSLVAYAELLQGDVLWELGLAEDAAAAWRESHNLLARTEDVSGRQAALLRLGMASFSRADYQGAAEYWRTGFYVALKTLDESASNSAGALANGVGLAMLLTGDLAEARTWLGLAFRSHLLTGSFTGQATALANAALLLIEEGRQADAIRSLQAARELLQSSRDDGESALGLEWQVAANAGIAYEARGDLELARAQYEYAITVIESIRSELTSEQLKLSWQERTQHVYERLIRLLIQEGEGSDAFLYVERCRARTFLDAMYQGGITADQLISPEAGISSGAVDPEVVVQAVDDACEMLLPNEAVLEYMATDRGAYLWVITAAGIAEPEFLEYPRDQLMNDVLALRQAVEGSNPDPITTTEFLESFYEKLVQESLATLPDGVDTLIIIPSGPLWYLPFSALMMSDQDRVQSGVLATRHPYLVEKFTLAYLPSLASLSSLAQQEAQTTTVEPLLALADPELPLDELLHEGEESKCGADEESKRYEVLVTACQAFADLLAGEEQETQFVYAGREAQEVLAHQDSGCQVVVYAAHGQFNPYVPLQSKLLLATSEETTNQEESDSRVLDGNYHAWEVLLTDYRGTDLVILAACETLLPHLNDVKGTMAVLADQACDEVDLTPQQLEKIVVGDEVVGLARAFLSSGAEAVVGTLWLANPHAIEKLLVSMAEHYKQGATWVQALTKAQRELIEGNTYNNPWFWAPYQLIGRWR